VRPTEKDASKLPEVQIDSKTSRNFTLVPFQVSLAFILSYVTYYLPVPSFRIRVGAVSLVSIDATGKDDEPTHLKGWYLDASRPAH